MPRVEEAVDEVVVRDVINVVTTFTKDDDVVMREALLPETVVGVEGVCGGTADIGDICTGGCVGNGY